MTVYVFLSQRVSQDQLVIELQKSGLGCYGKREQDLITNAINKATK